MTARAVHWHEGMFLRPHHLQTATRYVQHLANISSQWDVHYNWGIRRIEIDEAALANNRLVVRKLEARLRDGTLIIVPEEGALAAIDLKPALTGTNQSVTAYVGVPVLQLGRSNLALNSDLEGGRYRIDVLADLEDENKGGNPQTIQVRTLNVRLLLSSQDLAGYETLPIAMIEKSATAEAPLQLARGYVPPVLGCDAWKQLAGDVLQGLYDRLGRTIDLHAQHVSARNNNYESSAAGDHTVIEQLRSDNEGYAVLRTLAFAQGVHPFVAYVELCRLAGQLAIWGRRLGPRAPELPVYNHDDLGGCFTAVKKVLDELIDDQGRPEIDWRDFKSAASRMQVGLEPRWLQSTAQMFVRVESSLPRERCIDLFTRPGKLDMKIGGSDRVDEIHRNGQRGLLFAHAPSPPAVLPAGPGFIYFQINRDAQKDEWLNVQQSLTLAIRFNDAYIPGGIPQGQRVIKIRVDAATMATTQFTLFVVPQGR